MIGLPPQPRPTFPPVKRGLVILVAGLVILALGGLLFVLAITGGNARVTSEAYVFNLFVRMRNPGASAELWVPVPDFPQLRDQASVDPNFGDFPNPNVTQSMVVSPYGTMFRFVFSDSFAVRGAKVVTPGSANGTLTFSTQVSNAVRLYLTNVSSGNQVSFILHYEVARSRGFLLNDQVSFVGTADPRSPETGLVLPCGYLLKMISDEKACTVVSPGWGLYPLNDGGFSYSCD